MSKLKKGYCIKNLVFISVLIGIIFSSSLFANKVSYFSGQKEYLKKCRSCHKGSHLFVNRYTVEYWNDMMENTGEKLVAIHAKSKNLDIEEINIYLKSQRYQKKFKYIKAFVQRFAKDGDKNPDN